MAWRNNVSSSHMAASLQQIGTRWGRSMSRYQERSIRIEPQQKAFCSVLGLRCLAAGARPFPMHNTATFWQG
jgi:hypothetical protein